MITKLDIKNYKNLKSLELEGLKEVTLISGKNNIGKTSILEAILLLFSNQFSSQLVPVLTNRAVGFLYGALLFEPATAGIFSDYNLNNVINICSDHDQLDMQMSNKPLFMKNNGQGYPMGTVEFNALPTIEMDTLHLTIKYSRSNKLYYSGTVAKDPISSNYLPIESNQLHSVKLPPIILINEFGDLLRATDLISSEIQQIRHLTLVREYNNLRTNYRDLIQKYLIPALKLLDQDIIAIEIGNDIQNPQLSRIELIKKGKNKPEPLPTWGHGAKRLFNLILGIINARDGILLIDEIENGIHYSVVNSLWILIFEMAKECNCQIIASTHSWETSSYVVNQPEENQKLFSFVNIAKLKNGDLSSATYNFEQFSYAIETNSELR